ncbi:MAG TPA: PIN domain-containing protein [Candidatus Limnocylindrales bacterium]
MASVDDLRRSRRLILDAGGILALARGDGYARAALERARLQGYVVVIPTPVLAQVHRGGRDRAHVDRIVNKVDALLPTSENVARGAGELQAAAGTTDPVDAIVVAEALASIPALILTSDPDDLRRLLEAQPGSKRVAIVPV